MAPIFDHEKLRVYQASIDFIKWSANLIEDLPKSIEAVENLDGASTSIALNIAEGNGKFTEADRCRYFDNSRGSALECSACLDVLTAKGQIEKQQTVEGKKKLKGIVDMLVGLIKSNSDRVHERSWKDDDGHLLRDHGDYDYE